MKNTLVALLIFLIHLPLAYSQDCQVGIIRASTSNGIVLELKLRPADQVRGIRWSTGDSTNRILVSEPGVYCVKVAFAGGCIADDCIEIGRPDSTPCFVEIKRETLDSGIRLTAIPRPADAVVALKWSTASEDRSIVVREPGKYCVGVRFSTGCTAEACVEIPRTDPLECNVEIRREVTDSGIRLTAVPRPADAVVAFRWSTGSEDRSIVVREPGKYCVGVRFSTGCTAEACVEIPRLDSEECKVEIRRELLQGTMSAIQLKAIARPGDDVISFKWNTGDTTQMITVEKPGNYCVGVRFASRCTARDCVEIAGRDCQVGFERHTADSGFYVSIVPRPDTGIVAVKWSTGDTGRQIQVLAPGKYCVRVAYRNGCVAENCFEYERACSVHIRTSKGKLGAKARGIAPFVYYWSTGDSSEVIEVENPGEYCITVVDATGCKSETCIRYDPDLLLAANGDAQAVSEHREVYNPTGSPSNLVSEKIPGNSFVYPNPTDGIWNIQLPINQSGTFIVQVQDMQGKTHIQKILNLEKGIPIVEIDGSNLPPGLYLTLIHDSTRYWALKTIRK
ncbi:MAG: T9SS type A sorting domain-containing protein [Saprospiraceae bacterium]|nr:T9SS type A sorting domain-containing protein [Saprospiraceae bacterium]MCB9319178.1 T9SS type A sorting domain-containing protein [Lewinellaceae bacterium]